MSLFLSIIGVLVIFLGTIPIIYALRLRRFVNSELAVKEDDYSPKTSVILPCKGIDPGFDLNINAFLKQDYPNYELIFITATDDDPAYMELKKITGDVKSNIKTKILTAGIKENRGQKLNNLLKGIEEVSADTEVFAFVDSDTRPHKDFLRSLIKPLNKPGIGATTGFRWYLPEKGWLGSLLRSTWNGGGLPFLIDSKHNYAWGGAMAVKRSTFEYAGIKKAWENALSDDLTLTQCVKQIGLQIHFVPRCLVVSYEDSTLLETLEWTNRQQTIARVYAPVFWWSVTVVHGIANFLLISGVVFIVYSLVSGRVMPWNAAMIFFLIPLEMLDVFILLPTVVKLIPRHADRLNNLKWQYAFLAPAASFLLVINSIRSALSRKITWRGVKYEMLSPDKTIVINNKHP